VLGMDWREEAFLLANREARPQSARARLRRQILKTGSTGKPAVEDGVRPLPGRPASTSIKQSPRSPVWTCGFPQSAFR